MRASDLDFNAIPRFSASEWPAGVLEQMDAGVIHALAAVRAALPASHSMIPSPLRAAHVRESGNSRHSTHGGQRLSDATDTFIRWPHVWDAWRAAQAVPEVGGLGIYLDTHLHHRSWPMMHIDCRPERMLWVRYRPSAGAKPVYVYHHRQPREFFRVLAEYGEPS